MDDAPLPRASFLHPLPYRRKDRSRNVIFLLFLLLFVIGADVALYRIKGGYSLAKIRSNLPRFSESKEQDILQFAQVFPLLDQPFHFLSSGGTSFAFLGKDGKTILKLFKHQHLTQNSCLFRSALPGSCDILR